MRVVLLLAVFALVPAAQGSMQDALSGARLLRDITDARVVLMRPADRSGGSNRTGVYGVVFAFEGCAWIYAAEFGNRVLGPAGVLDAPPEQLAARLADAGLPCAKVELYPTSPALQVPPGQFRLPNGCVIGALAALERRLLADAGIRNAGLVLLSYHVKDPKPAATFVVDHCVLVILDRNGWHCIDPRRPDDSVSLGRLQVGEPIDSRIMALASRSPYPLASARLLPIAASTLEEITTAALWRWDRARTGPAP